MSYFVADSSGLECIYRIIKKNKTPFARYNIIHVSSETASSSRISGKFAKKHLVVHKVPALKIMKTMNLLKVSYETASALSLAKRLNAIYLTASKEAYIKARKYGLKALLVEYSLNTA